MEELISKYLLTGICVTVIGVWFIVAREKFISAVEENPFGDYEQPRTAATLGVLGTFIGVAFGLFVFDPSPAAIQKSVTNLLGGMTTAFFTSILGMGMSLYFKNIQVNAQKKSQAVGSIHADATISDLIQYLRSADAQKSNDTKILLDAVNKLTTSLVGDGDYTVIGQLKTLRLEFRDGNEKIISELRNFGKTLAENNSKAFIEALNETMRDFNQKLTEQFGENFKQLNVAVGRLLEWQINYEKTIETVTNNLETAFAGIDAAKNSIVQIEKSSSAIKESSETTRDLIVTANFYEQKLAAVLAEIKELGDAAEAAVPNMTDFVSKSCDEIENLTGAAAHSVEIMSGEIKAAADSATGDIQNLANSMSATTNFAHEMTSKITNLTGVALKKLDDFSQQAVNSMQEVSKRIESTSYKQREIMDAEVQATKNAVQKAADTLKNDSMAITKNVTDSIHGMMKANNENLQKATENINRNLESTLKTAVDKFGGTMVAVSEKFVSDYLPLTEKLAAVVRIAEGVGRR